MSSSSYFIGMFSEIAISSSHYGVEMKHWSMHDLRRTARTHFSRFTSRDIAELMIGHTMPGEQSTYDYHDYQEEMAVAYKDWWDKLQSLTK